MAKITTQANGIRSQKRTKISLSNNQRIGASNSRRQRRKFHRSGDGVVSSLSFTSSDLNGIRSQKRTKISLSNNQRIGASNSRRQRRKFHRSGDGVVSSLSFTS